MVRPTRAGVDDGADIAGVETGRDVEATGDAMACSGVAEAEAREGLALPTMRGAFAGVTLESSALAKAFLNAAGRDAAAEAVGFLRIDGAKRRAADQLPVQRGILCQPVRQPCAYTPLTSCFAGGCWQFYGLGGRNSWRRCWSCCRLSNSRSFHSWLILW